MSRPIIALAITVLAATAHAQGSAESNNPRTQQEQGASGYIKGDGGSSSETIGGRGLSRQEDIRRTSSGDIRLSPEVEAALKSAAASGELERSTPPLFTVAIGAAVPQQAGARELPATLKQQVPTGEAMNYILADDRLILIDGRTQRIVAIVPGMS